MKLNVPNILTLFRIAAIPVVVFSTERTESDRERAAALGADGYLVKPFGEDELGDTVLPLLGLGGEGE